MGKEEYGRFWVGGTRKITKNNYCGGLGLGSLADLGARLSTNGSLGRVGQRRAWKAEGLPAKVLRAYRRLDQHLFSDQYMLSEVFGAR